MGLLCTGCSHLSLRDVTLSTSLINDRYLGSEQQVVSSSPADSVRLGGSLHGSTDESAIERWEERCCQCGSWGKRPKSRNPLQED